MTHLPGMQDTAIIAVVIIMLIAGALIGAIWFAGRRLDRAFDFQPNQDIKHFTPRAHRPAWLAGIVIALALIGLTSWTAQRDEAARYADAALHASRLSPLASPRANDPLDRLLARTRCRAPDYPLEQFVIAIGSEADGEQPTISCVYITADLGVRPKLTYERPVMATIGER
jgi:hypothetical protein